MMDAPAFRYRSNGGFTLVELLVAGVIGLIVLGIALTIFSQSYKVSRATTARGHIQEKGRLADAVLGRDLRQADSFGCARMDQVDTNTIGLPVTMTSPGGPPVTGLDGSSAPGLSNSDSITVRGGTGISARVQQQTGVAQPLMLVNPIAQLQPDSLVAVTNCRNEGGNSTTDVFAAATGTAGATINLPAALSRTYRNGTAFEVRKIRYRIANNTNGRPTLQRRVNGGGWQDLIENIYAMQIVYGEDTDSDDAANRYVAADKVGNFADVVAIRAQLIVGGGSVNVNQFTPNTDASGNQIINFDSAFGGTSTTLPDGRIGRRFTIAAAVRARMP